MRQTMNRLAAIVIPPAMGVIADHWGAGQSFVILGTVLLVLCAPVTLITRRVARTVTVRAVGVAVVVRPPEPDEHPLGFLIAHTGDGRQRERPGG